MTANRNTMKADIQDVLITVARIDEKVKTIFNRQSSIEKRVNSMDEKINEISPSVKFGERVFWIILVVTLTVIGSYY
jgi:peptidoglycan hydrolase CwlO-like protein|tara:strand:- start:504 stop:734 length:231 start_codon:yes stop_codon:yes gene_type:complete